MLSAETYKLLHVIGVLCLFLGLGGVLALGKKDGAKLFMILHGIGLLVMLVAGIGYAHKASMGWPNWMIAKIGCWLLLGALPVLVRKGVLPTAVAFLLTLGIGGAAVWLVQAKPF
ncbi:MAG: hypothetical protein H6835_02500 [Planctomycetes bacterium]|nr:hypothetical protein [Planctomycetota bacterium]